MNIYGKVSGVIEAFISLLERDPSQGALSKAQLALRLGITRRQFEYAYFYLIAKKVVVRGPTGISLTGTPPPQAAVRKSYDVEPLRDGGKPRAGRQKRLCTKCFDMPHARPMSEPCACGKAYEPETIEIVTYGSSAISRCGG